MSKGNNQRAVICGIAVVPLTVITMGAPMGLGVAQVRLNGVELIFKRPQSASFTEKKSASGDYVVQELEATFTDTTYQEVGVWRGQMDEDSIVLVKYSNGETRVVGTDRSPVRCEMDESGTPRTVKLSFKRKSPEFSKIAESLN